MDQEVAKGFDLQVTYRDERTGLVTHKNPYTLRVIEATDGGKSRIYERPVGSGNIWDKKGNPIGRWLIDEKTKKGKFIKDVQHIVFTPPETQDQKLVRSLTEKDGRIAALEKELGNIRAEAKIPIFLPKNFAPIK